MKKILVSFLCALCFLIQVSVNASPVRLTVGSSTTSEYSENIQMTDQLAPARIVKIAKAVVYGVSFAAGFVHGFAQGFTQGPPQERVAVDPAMLNYKTTNLVLFD